MTPLPFETDPSRYRHWTLEIDGPVARLGMKVEERGGLSPDYALKLNSYDLAVDIELADAIRRLRFGHPGVHALVVTSLRERMFCAGANIHMLAGSSHPFKVNFCKYTNETRIALEDLAARSGIRTLCALNGTASGGGYELALACEEILLVDDGSSAVAFPEVPLLGVLPGTGGLTRLVDKRRVRRDRADHVSTLVEGIRGRRAVEWKLVDGLVPRSRFEEEITRRAGELAGTSDRPEGGEGIELEPLGPRRSSDATEYRHVSLFLDRRARTARLVVRAPEGNQPRDPESFLRSGSDAWAVRVWRELDDALLALRFDEPEIGLVLLETEGNPEAVLDVDRTLHTHRSHWLVREILELERQVLKRLDLTARSLFAMIGPGSAFAGSLFELALAADRSYMRFDEEHPTSVALSPLNGGILPMANGLGRLATRFLDDSGRVEALLRHEKPFDAEAALEAGLVTFAPDDIDWDDEVRLAIEERASLNPDALTGMEASLRFAGPETMETKIFGRLSAWQNWVFARPNATGEKGTLSLYGKSGEQPAIDYRRT